MKNERESMAESGGRMRGDQFLGDLSHLDGFADTIDSDHATELRSYFRTGGTDKFSRSTASGMLDRAELYSAATRPCERCGGHVHKGTWVETDGAGNQTEVTDPIPDQAGCGFVPSGSKRNKAVSQKNAELLALMGIETDQVPISADEVCPDCRCHGWVVCGVHAVGPLTARPSMTAHHGEPVAPNMDIDLHIAAICGKRLERADVLFALASGALSSFYYPGSLGIGSLWHLTPAGKKMLKGNSTNTSPEQFFAARRVAQESNKDPNVSRQFAACDEQAKAIMSAACRAWNAVVAHEGRVRACGT
jgi:hypothetical protein